MRCNDETCRVRGAWGRRIHVAPYAHRTTQLFNAFDFRRRCGSRRAVRPARRCNTGHTFQASVQRTSANAPGRNGAPLGDQRRRHRCLACARHRLRGSGCAARPLERCSRRKLAPAATQPALRARRTGPFESSADVECSSAERVRWRARPAGRHAGSWARRYNACVSDGNARAGRQYGPLATRVVYRRPTRARAGIKWPWRGTGPDFSVRQSAFYPKAPRARVAAAPGPREPPPRHKHRVRCFRARGWGCRQVCNAARAVAQLRA